MAARTIGRADADRDERIAELGQSIRRRHKAVEQHARSLLAEAVEAGGELTELKSLLPHGEFGPHVRGLGVPDRSRQLYMQLAREWERRNVALLDATSIRDALRRLATPREKPRPPLDPWFHRTLGGIGGTRLQWRLWVESMVEKGRGDDPSIRRHVEALARWRAFWGDAQARRLEWAPYGRGRQAREKGEEGQRVDAE